MCVRVNYTAEQAFSNLAMRMTIMSQDKVAVGLATSKPCIQTNKGANEVELTLSLNWLAPGKYIVKLTAYSVNEYGTNLMHDVVDECFAFEKTQNLGDNNRMTWNHSWWGYMMFPELDVEVLHE